MAIEGFARYLLAKRSIDDRALNQNVWERLRRELRGRDSETLRIVDIGAGLGTGAERIAEWRLSEPLAAIRYTGIEPRGELLEEARFRLRSLPFPAELVASTLSEFAGRQSPGGSFDLVVAHAVLDLLELSPALETLVGLARPGGILYCPITFDGETIFEPRSRDDDAILAAYHETMEERGSSRTGRRLFHAFRSLGMEVLETGSSDWIVHSRGGDYPQDDAFFLQFLLSAIEAVLRNRVEPSVLHSWLAERRRQVESADLYYCAHQIDVLARKPS